jgi:hypothetical protein
MRVFADEKKREWKIEVTYSVLKRIKAALDYDPLELFNGKPEPAATVLYSAIVRIDTLWRCCETQALAVKPDPVSNDDFCDSLVGASLDAAWKAFELELIDFFPPSRRQQILAAAEKGKEVTAAVVRKIGEEIAGVDAERQAEAILTAARNGSLLAPRSTR